MASIVTSGIGSGLDINGLVTQLVAAEREPVERRLSSQEARYQAQISGYGSFKSALADFRSILSAIGNSSGFEATSATSSDTASVGVQATSTAAAGSYRVSVAALAQTHTLVMSGVGDINDIVGSGTLTFRFGTTVYDPSTDIYTSFTANPDKPTRTLTIDTSNNTLAGLRDAINEADLGVQAGIIYDGTQYRLTLTSSESGASNSLQIEVADDDLNNGDSNGLSRLAFNGIATNLEQTVAGQNASFTLNGLAVTSSSNSVASAIDGVTLDLKRVTTGQPVVVEVSRNTTPAGDAVRSFVSGYNQLMATLKDLTRYDPETGQAGVLQGDGTVRSAMESIRRTLNQGVQGLDGPYRTLADIGVTTDSNGMMAIDQAKLDAALAYDAEAIGRLFVVSGSTSSSRLRYLGGDSATTPGTYAVEVIQPATQGYYAGTAFGYGGTITVDATNDNISLRVDGVDSAQLTLTQGTYNGEQLAVELQTRINGDANLRAAGITVAVAFDTVTQSFSVTSSRYGSASKVEILAVDSNAAVTMGLAVGSGAAGSDVAGTIGGLAATGSGRILTGTGAAQGLQVEPVVGATGALGSVSYTRGIADRLNSLFTDMLDADSLIGNRLSGLEGRIEDITEQREKLDVRMTAYEARLRTQFGAMDALVGQLRATGSYLEQQLASLPTIGRPGKSG